MDMKTYASFEVLVDHPAAKDQGEEAAPLPVLVLSSPAGPATGELKLDLAAEEFRTQLALARGEGPNLAARRAFGERLFLALFNDDVRDAWRTSLAKAQPPEADGLRLRLWINEPRLAALPWELLYDPQMDFLATRSDVTLSRYLPVVEPDYLPPQEQLRVLLVISRPDGLPEIDSEEKTKLTDAIAGLGPRVQSRVLENVPVSAIQDALQQTDTHVLHFLGHGTAGKLVLAKDGGRSPHPIGDQQLARLFLGRRSLRLIVLNACHSSQAPEGGLFSGVGPALIQKRMPAVIAMQYPSVYQDTASRFSQVLYRSLANGLPVDLAVNEARQLLSAGDLLEDRDWSTPVLYLGTRSGHILGFVREGADLAERAWQSVQVAAAAAPEAQETIRKLSERFQEIAEKQVALRDWLRLSNRIQELRAGFEPCRNIVMQAMGNPVQLQGQLPMLMQSWTQMRQNNLAALQAFVEGHPELGGAIDWYEPLDALAQEISTQLNNWALGPLMNTVPQFGMGLAQAEAHLRQRLDRAVGELFSMSDRTLGGLAVY
jgi:hypothetical protein